MHNAGPRQFIMCNDSIMKDRVFLFVTFSVCVLGKNLPPDIKKCRRSDPDLAKCLETNVVDGIQKLSGGNKDLAIPPLEPLVIEKIDLGNQTGRVVSVHQVHENIKLYGVTNLTAYDTEVNFSDDNCFWHFKTKTPKMVIESDYKVTGRMLVFALNGHGKSKVTFYDSETNYEAKCTKYTKRNKKYIRVTDLAYKLVPSKVVFDIENIVDGNEQLSREVLKTLNENALEIYTEVGAGMDEVTAKIWKENVNRVFGKISEEELFLA